MRLAGLMILTLILLGTLPGQAHSENVSECTLRIAAVTTGGEGVLGNITVKVTSGEGRVYISTSPATEVDTQGAARMAAFTATLLLGINLEDYDFYYKLEAPSIIVGGPSAGAAMTIATIAALTGAQCTTPNVITGMIYPDSTIGPVGGLKDKLRAVAEGGGTLFIVPKGQLVYTSYERVIQRIGPLAIVRSVPVQVNLSLEGENLGVKVVEAGSISEAASMLLGMKLPSLGGEPRQPQGLKDVYARLVEMYHSMLDIAKNTQHKDLVEEAEAHRRAAEDLAGRGLYFPASRGLVDGLALLQTAVWLQEAEEEGYNVTRMLREAAMTINETTRSLYDVKTEAGGVASLYTWIAASRLKQADDGLNDGSLPRVLTLTGTAIDYTPLLLISYSKWLAEYAGLLGRLDWIPIGNAEGKGMIAASLGKAVTAYATTLLREAGVEEPGALEEAVDLVVSASVEKNKVTAAYLSLAGTAMAMAAIHVAFDGDILMPYAEKLAYSLASKTGSMAASALLQAYQYYREQGNLDRAWTYLDLSILASWMLMNPNPPQQQEQESPAPGAGGVIRAVTVTETVTMTPEKGGEPGTGQNIPGAVVAGLLLGTAIGVVLGVIAVYSRKP